MNKVLTAPSPSKYKIKLKVKQNRWEMSKEDENGMNSSQKKCLGKQKSK